jgi:hypothetical protein
MTTPPPAPKKRRRAPVEDRRAPASAKGASVTLSKLKGALNRPVRVERRDGSLHVVLVERRRAPRDGAALTERQVRQELGALLLADAHGDAPRVMRHLVHVHDELGRRGWAGVEFLPWRVLLHALSQAEMLTRDERSPALALLIERLRVLQVAAGIREERRSRAQADGEGTRIDVKEASAEDFEAASRTWVGTVPSDTPDGKA